MTSQAPDLRSVAPRRRLAPAERRAQIVAVGSEVFIENGYQGTSLEDIAGSAGVTRPLIYRYFRDKDELYLEILRSARAELDDALVSAVAAVDGTPVEQLHAGLVAYFSFVRDHGRQWDLLFGGGTAVAGSVASEATELRFATAEKVALLIAAAVPGLGDRAGSAYAHAVSGASEQLAKWWRRNPDASLEEIVTFNLDVVWGGLERRAHPGPEDDAPGT
ncbi:MAG: TetR/AcrR family transcriptional regulator [Marmoricola sp.]